MLNRLLTITCSIFVINAHAGLLETLSTGSYYVVNKKACETNDEKKSIAALSAASTCLNSKNENQIDSLNSLVGEIKAQTAEDQFFSILASNQVNQLQCASKFAKVMSSENSESNAFQKDVEVKIKEIRKLKTELTGLTTSLAKDANISEKVCPVSLDDLQKEAGAQKEYKEICGSIIRTRLAIHSISITIPLYQTSSIRNFIEVYSSQSNVPEKSDRLILDAYQKATKEISDAQTTLKDAIANNKIDRTTRRALLADPLQVQKIIQASPPSILDDLMCQIDGRYGKGAEYLDTGVMLGSFLAMGSGAAVKVTGAALKLYQGANAARAAALLSKVGTGLIQIGAIGGGGLTAYADIDKSCNNDSLPKLKKQEASGCEVVPTIEEVEHNNCLLSKTLAVLSASDNAVSTIPAAAMAFGIMKVRKALPPPGTSETIPFGSMKVRTQATKATSETVAIEASPIKASQQWGDNGYVSAETPIPTTAPAIKVETPSVAIAENPIPETLPKAPALTETSSKEASALLKPYTELQNKIQLNDEGTFLAPKIFASSRNLDDYDWRAATKDYETSNVNFKANFKELDPKLKEIYVNLSNDMNSPRSFAEYRDRLFLSITDDIQATQNVDDLNKVTKLGQFSKDNLSNTLIKKFAARGEALPNLPTDPKEKLIYLLQRDYASEILKKQHVDPKEFWAYIDSPKGKLTEQALLKLAANGSSLPTNPKMVGQYIDSFTTENAPTIAAQNLPKRGDPNYYEYYSQRYKDRQNPNRNSSESRAASERSANATLRIWEDEADATARRNYIDPNLMLLWTMVRH